MSTERAAVFGDELERAAAALGSLPAVERLAALGFDVLSRQAEGKSLYAGKKFAAGRAQAHGVKRNEADTPLGNVVAIVERGAEGATQQALLAALFVRGFGDAYGGAAPALRGGTALDSSAAPALRGGTASDAARADDRAALLARFVDHCEWLELEAGQRVWPLLPQLLPAALVSDVHAALGAACLQSGAVARSSAPSATRDPRARARAAGRIALLAEADSDAARSALGRIADEHGDEFVRGLAALTLGRPRASAPEPSAGCSLHGRSGPKRRGVALSVLGWLSGVSLAWWLVRVVLFAIGYRRDVELSLRGDALSVRRVTQLLGRTIVDEQRVHPVEELCAAQRTARYPMLHAAVGTVCFALGVLLGGALGFDALRAGEPALLRWAALWVLAGSGLDLALAVLWPAGQGRVGLDLDLGRGKSTRLTAVPLGEADRFLEALWQRLERPRRKDPRALA